MRSERRARSAVSLFISRFPGSLAWGTAVVIVMLGGYSVARARTAETILQRTERELGSERFTVGRLSDGGVWQPCSVTDTTGVVLRSHCGSPPTAKQDTERLEAVVRDLRTARQSDSSADIQRVSALLDLRFRDSAPSALDRAIASLNAAARLAPSNPVVFNALAVALLEKGEREQDLRATLQALEAVQRAASLDSASTAILFN